MPAQPKTRGASERGTRWGWEWGDRARRGAAVPALCAAALSIGAAQVGAAPPTQAPAVPPALEVAAGHELFLAGYAEGTQNYVCLPATTGGVAWRFLGPQATLFHTFKGSLRQQATTHFLSADATGTARPTWQDSIDSSRVWGRVLASSSDPGYVQAGAIPWLLLEAVDRAEGPMGGAGLAQASYVQRLNTWGGVAPASGCTDSSHVGAVALVPYTTDYYFYRPAAQR